MKELHCADRKELAEAIEMLTAGDCIIINSFSCAASSAKSLLSAIVKIADRNAHFVSLQEGVDTRNGQGEAFFQLCRAFHELDRTSLQQKQREGIDRAKEEGLYKGRKPIAVDENLFESVTALWESGQISARQAMAELNLKPNTFYRRIKEREEQKMKDYKTAEREIRDELKEAARQSRRELDDLKKQVKDEAKEFKKAADDKLDAHDVEKEIRRSRIRAENEYNSNVRQIKKDVETEAKELKKLISEE